MIMILGLYINTHIRFRNDIVRRYETSYNSHNQVVKGAGCDLIFTDWLIKRSVIKWYDNSGGRKVSSVRIVAPLLSSKMGTPFKRIANMTFVGIVASVRRPDRHRVRQSSSPLSVGMLCLFVCTQTKSYLMGLNLSNRQIAAELGVKKTRSK